MEPIHLTSKREHTERQFKLALSTFLESLGVDVNDPHFERTPRRFVEAYRNEILAGYREDPKKILAVQFDDSKYSEMVIVKDIPLYSLCEHHLLPFFGKACVAYIPNGRITGLSKLVRLVECFSRRLQVQERLTIEIVDALFQNLMPLGAGVVIDCEHFCITCRGVNRAGTVTKTSALRGVFMDDAAVKAEFIQLSSTK